MKAPSVKPVRCAIYTRVSTDHGLDQEFNSLDAQYDAASAYIKSQAHAGWTLIRSRYDDRGYSGGSTDRPDLQRLLEDIRARKIDVIVVGLRQASRTLRYPRRVIRLGHPAVQHHDLDGAVNAQCAPVLCPVRAGGHLGAHPRQDRSIKAKRDLGRGQPSSRV